MTVMRIDHVSYAAEPDGMVATAQRLSERLGVPARDGGVHPRFGTRNMVLPLTDTRYLEVVEVLDHPASDKAPFGQAVRARSQKGGGWMAWVIALESLTKLEASLGREAVPGHRHTPEGVDLTWRQIGIKGNIADPQLPFFVRWDSLEHHPSTLAPTNVGLAALKISGNRERVQEWIGLTGSATPDDSPIAVEFDGGDEPELAAVTFRTSDGDITI